MEVRDKVKQRRMERLRNLRESRDYSYGFDRNTLPPSVRDDGPSYREPEPPLYVDPEWARRMEDPEFAWRQKLKMDTTLSGREYGDEEMNWFWPPSRRTIVAKLFISCIMFAAIWGMFHVQHPLAIKGKAFVTTSLNQSYDFTALSAWYEKSFGGSPSFIPSFHQRGGEEAVGVSTSKRTFFVPAKGRIITPFQAATHTGVLLNTQPDAPVYALDTGQVIFSGPREDTGYTVVIRHPGGLESVYGHVNEASVQVNDWIKGGEALGKASKEVQAGGNLYFALKRDGHPLNPTDVISFD